MLLENPKSNGQHPKNEEQLLKEIQQLKALVENIKSYWTKVAHVPSIIGTFTKD